MGKIILCLGQIAKNPYSFEKLGVRIYSVEELCFYLEENAYLIDDDFISEGLLNWLEQECGLSELVHDLYPLIGKRNSLLEGVQKLLNYVGLYDAFTTQTICDQLQLDVGLSKLQKQKQQGDFLLKNQKYVKALIEYDLLLDELQETDMSLKMTVLHNKGVALANLFAFSQAAECFEQAYQLKQSDEYFRDYLAAKRMQLSDDEYVEFVSENQNAYEVSLQLEKEVDSILEHWEQCDQYNQVKGFIDLKEKETNLYYEEMDIRVRALKEKYRECTQI